MYYHGDSESVILIIPIMKTAKKKDQREQMKSTVRGMCCLSNIQGQRAAGLLSCLCDAVITNRGSTHIELILASQQEDLFFHISGIKKIAVTNGLQFSPIFKTWPLHP